MSANDVAEANKRIDDYGDMSIKHRELVIEAKKRLKALGENLEKKRTGKRYLAPVSLHPRRVLFLGFGLHGAQQQ